MKAVRVTCLVDFESARPDLETEHGLAFLVESPDESLLFDSGASEAAFNNALRLGLHVKKIRRIVLSHGHNDHTGGLAPFLAALSDVDIYLHPHALGPKYSLHPGKALHDLTMPLGVQSLLQARMARLHLATCPMRLTDIVGITGPVGRVHPVQHQSLYCDPKGQERDGLEDDMALWIRGSKGLTVVLGCAHAGVINTLEHIQRVTGEKRIHTVVGGMHLARASREDIALLIRQLAQMGVARAMGIHCTGIEASRMLREAFSDSSLRAGESLDIAIW